MVLSRVSVSASAWKAKGRLVPPVLEGHDAIGIAEGAATVESQCRLLEVGLVGEPVVIIEKADAVARGVGNAHVARRNGAALRGCRARVIDGCMWPTASRGAHAVIDHDDLLGRMRLRQHAGDRLLQEMGRPRVGMTTEMLLMLPIRWMCAFRIVPGLVAML